MSEMKFEVRTTEEKGRGLFATCYIKQGDVIFEEIPIVSCQFAWNEDYGYQACELCLRPLESAVENVKRLTMNEFTEIPYPELCNVNKETQISCIGCGVKYCCIECQQIAWNKYHRTLCLQKLHRDNTHPLEQLKEVWKQMHFPPESTTALIFVKFFATIHQFENKEVIKSIMNKFCHETSNKNENITHKLLGIKFSDQVETLRQLIKASVPTEYAEEWITPEGFSQLLVLVGMNGQGIGTSSFSEWVKNVSKIELPLKEKQSIDNYIDAVYENFDKGVGDFLNNEGSGLYELQSTINHSCSPNAEVTFPNSNYQLAVVATENITPGDEICISYLDMCSLSRSRHSRQKVLQENYLFTCKCHKCEEQVHHPDETSSDESDESMDS